MQTVLIVIHLLIVLSLIGVVLLQRSEGGLGLSGGGGGGVGGFLTGRGQANALTRATAILAAAFFVTSLALGILAHRGAAPRSIFEGASTPAPGSAPPSTQGDSAPPSGGPAPSPSIPAPAGSGGVLDEIQRLQDSPAQPQVPRSR